MIRRLLLIGNAAVDAPGTIEVRNPHTGEVAGTCAKAGPAELERATAAAVRGFGETRRLPAHRRAAILSRAAAGLAARREELARLITSENAKPLRLSRGEVDRAAATFGIAAEEATRIGGEVLPLDLNPAAEGRIGITRRFPLGPVLGIAPFNFPLNLVAHKVAPAIAAGNTIVVKPASATPLTALALGDVLVAAGATEGMVNVVPCAAADADAMVADERFRAVTFTGSPAVGWALRARAGRKRVTLELGGNAAVVVHEDADLDRAVERCAMGAFAFAGQVCISVQRIYLHERIAGAFTERFVARARALVVGDPADERTDVGPMIDEAAVARTQAWVDAAAAGGARVLCGGRRDGRFFPPTVLEGVKADMDVHCGEVFAPVANLYRYSDFEAALAEVNASAFGLQAGVFTRDTARVMRAFEALEVGGVIVNDGPHFRVDAMPYGGEKASGHGREGVRYAIEELTAPRLLVL